MNNLPYWQQGIKGVKKEAVSKADVRSGDGINSGSNSGGGSGTDEFAKKLLARNFENGTLVIPDSITELGPGAINLGFNLGAVKLNPDNISVISDRAFDFGIQTMYYIGLNNIDESCAYAIALILDMSEGTSTDKIIGIIQSCDSLMNKLYDIKIYFLPLAITSASMYAPMVSQFNPSSFFDINLSKKAISCALPYFTIELDRDELPENILFINYNEQTGVIQNNLFTPDLSYIKGESFVSLWTLEEFPPYAIQYLDLENLPDTYADYDCISINSEEMLSEAVKDYMTSNIKTKLIYKTDIIKDGKNLFFIQPEILLNRTINLATNLSLPLLTFEYQENRWYALKQKEEPTP